MSESSSASGAPSPDRSSIEPERVAPSLEVQSPEQLWLLLEENLPRLRDIVARSVRSHGKGIEAEDVLQELLIRIQHSASKGFLFDSVAKLLHYAKLATRHLLIDLHRRGSVRKHRSLEEDDSEAQSTTVPSSEVSPLDRLLALESGHRVDDAFARIVAGLPDERMKKLVQMHYQGGRSLEEAANELKVSRATAYNWLSRFRSALRRALQEQADTEL